MRKVEGARTPVLRKLAAFSRDRGGATAIEYAMIAFFLSITISATVFGVGNTLKTNFYGKVNQTFSANQ